MPIRRINRIGIWHSPLASFRFRCEGRHAKLLRELARGESGLEFLYRAFAEGVATRAALPVWLLLPFVYFDNERDKHLRPLMPRVSRRRPPFWPFAKRLD